MARNGGRVLAFVVACAFAFPAVAGAATIEVTTKQDELDGSPDAKCSVREAVQSANDDAPVGGCSKGDGADIVKLRKGHYTLTIPSTDEDLNANGDLDVKGDKVTFLGKGDGVTDINTGLDDRIVEVRQDTDAAFRDIQLFSGDVTSLGPSLGRGGNLAADEGGNEITLTRAAITGGDAYTGGGLYMAGQSGGSTLKISRSTLTLNHATGAGGAIDVVLDVTSKISKSRIAENSVTDNSSASEAGAIFSRGGTMTITDTSFEDNRADSAPMQAGFGGAIHNASPAQLVVRRSLFQDNEAFGGVGFFEAGGAIYSANGAAITNTTFFRSDANQGAVLYLNGGTAIIANATVNANGTSSALHGAAGYMLVRNSILQGPDPCFGTIIDSGSYNVASVNDPACDFHGTDVTNAASFGLKDDVPELNGGFTRTFALKKSSPAVDLIPKTHCNVTNGEDQRGFKRPKRKCDAGAYERRAEQP